MDRVKKLNIELLGKPSEDSPFDEDTKREENAYLNAKNNIAIDKSKAELDSYTKDTKAREKFSNRIFLLLIAVLLAMFLLIFLDGKKYLDIDDNVLIALITGTTTDIIALVYLVTQYYFPKNNIKKDSTP